MEDGGQISERSGRGMWGWSKRKARKTRAGERGKGREWKRKREGTGGREREWDREDTCSKSLDIICPTGLNAGARKLALVHFG